MLGLGLRSVHSLLRNGDVKAAEAVLRSLSSLCSTASCSYQSVPCCSAQHTASFARHRGTWESVGSLRGFRTSTAPYAEDYYKVLGLSKDASDQDIKKSYYKLAKKYHPDTNKDNPDAALKFQEVSKAYETLRDPEKRSMYDQLGRERMEQMEAEGGMGGAGAGPFGAGGGQPFNANDVFEHFMRTDPLFNMFFRQQTVMNSTIQLTLEDAVQGCKRDIKLQIPGQKPTSVTIEVPPGVDSGHTISVQVPGGKNQPHMTIMLSVDVLPHKVFARDGRNLHVAAYISLVDALLGSTIQVPTLYGMRSLKVPQCSMAGEQMVLPGLGCPDPRGYGRGDLYITLKVRKPQAPLTERQRHLLVEFDREEAEKGKAKASGTRSKPAAAGSGHAQQQQQQSPQPAAQHSTDGEEEKGDEQPKKKWSLFG